MLESVNFKSSVPVYDQIENQVQFAIVAGELEGGDQLPTVRELAERLDVNPNTVVKSYRDLEVMGVITGRRGMGYFVNKTALPKIRDACLKRIVGRLHEVVSEGKSAGLSSKDIAAVLGESFSSEAVPYSDVPKNVKAKLKKK